MGPPPRRAHVGAAAARLIVAGTSTGGPQALTSLVRTLPEGFPVPIAAVIHLPGAYTAAFAKRLDGESALHVFEAADGEVLEPGCVAIARGGIHLVVDREGNRFRTRLDREPCDALHRPSVDRLFQSACASGSARDVIAVVMTGMGDDGVRGAAALRAAGATILVEEESSCVVYGMPRCVKEAGLAHAEAPINEMAELLTRYAVGEVRR